MAFDTGSGAINAITITNEGAGYVAYPTEKDMLLRNFSWAIEECLRVRDYQRAQAIDRERREYLRAIEQSGYGYDSFPNLRIPWPPPPIPKPLTTEEQIAKQIAAQKPYGAREIIFD